MVLPPLPPSLPLSAHFGLLGHIGITAHYGMLEIAMPRVGDTVVISAASGAVGSLAGQIATLSGAHVIGIAGSDEKCRRLTQELNFDSALNYKTTNVSEALSQLCPDGIDIYFDNVGGVILDAALGAMKVNGKVIFSGMISEYNKERSAPTGLTNITEIISKRLSCKGFICLDHMDHAEKAFTDLITWHLQNKIQYQVDVRSGLENAPDALNALFDGSNAGKLIIEVA